MAPVLTASRMLSKESAIRRTVLSRAVLYRIVQSIAVNAQYSDHRIDPRSHSGIRSAPFAHLIVNPQNLSVYAPIRLHETMSGPDLRVPGLGRARHYNSGPSSVDSGII